MNLNTNTDSFEVGMLPPNTILVVKRDLKEKDENIIVNSTAVETENHSHASTQNQGYTFNDSVKLSPDLELSFMQAQDSSPDFKFEYENEDDLELSFTSPQQTQDAYEAELDFDIGIKIDEIDSSNIDIAYLNTIA